MRDSLAGNRLIQVGLLQRRSKQLHEVDHVAAQVAVAAHDDAKRAGCEPSESTESVDCQAPDDCVPDGNAQDISSSFLR